MLVVEILEPDSLVRIKEVQIVVSGKEETTLAGFLRRHMVKHKKKYNGQIAQILEIFSDKSESLSDRQKFHRSKGCCRAVLLDLADDGTLPIKKCPAVQDDGKQTSKKHRS